MIKAAIFDLDGLLINSEPFWQRAEMEVFPTVGLHLTVEDCKKTQGFRIDEAVAYWYHKHPWDGHSIKDISSMVVNRLLQLVRAEGKPMPGVLETLSFFKGRKIPMAVASSSNLHIIETALEALNIQHYFDEVCSAQFEEYGKPHPAVFINTAQKLKTATVDCIVFEDSFYGLIAAKAAKMKAVAVPEPLHYNDPKFAFADINLRSLEEWNDEVFQQLQ